MAIKVACACGKTLAVKDELAGKKVRCPDCQNVFSIPESKVQRESPEDEWDMRDSAADDFADEPSDAPVKSRGGKSSASRGSMSRKSSSKGKKSKSSNRGLLLGVSAAGGVLVVALLAWMLWPPTPAANIAGNPPANQAEPPAPANGDLARPSPSAENALANLSSSANVPASQEQTKALANLDPAKPSPSAKDAPANPSPSANTPAIVAADDLKALQGDWHFVDMQRDPPAPPSSLAAIKLGTVTIAGDSMTIDPGAPGAPKVTITVKLDSSKNPKTIDTTSIDGPNKGKAGMGIYSLEGHVLKLHVSESNRPTSFTPIAGAREGVMVLNRGRPAALAKATIAEDKFDHNAWKRAQPTLTKLKIQSRLLTRREAPESVPEGLQAIAVLVLPDLGASERYPDNIASTIKSQSHVIVKTLEMNDAKLKQLSEHAGLVGLNLSGKSIITADGLSQLKRCSLLRDLHLSQVNMTPDLMKMIGEFSHLRSLSLDDMPITDELLSNLLSLKGLETLSLQNTSVTDAGTAHLAKLSSVKVLFLEGSKITDQGLPALQSLGKLTMFSVRRLNVSPQAVDAFQKALPGCQILK